MFQFRSHCWNTKRSTNSPCPVPMPGPYLLCPGSNWGTVSQSAARRQATQPLWPSKPRYIVMVVLILNITHSCQPLVSNSASYNDLSPDISVLHCCFQISSPAYSLRQSIPVKAGLPWFVLPCTGCHRIVRDAISYVAVPGKAQRSFHVISATLLIPL